MGSLRTNFIKWHILSLFCFVLPGIALSQENDKTPVQDSIAPTLKDLIINDDYLKIRASGSDPVYTTYAAAMERSRLYGDKAYKMIYYSGSEPLHYTSDQSGRFYSVWMVNSLVIDNITKYFQKPTVIASFPDMVILEYQPLRGLLVQETFFVFSSKVAMVRMSITNRTGEMLTIDLYPLFEMKRNALQVTGFDRENNGYIALHQETKERLISDLYADAPYPTDLVDYFSVDFNPYSFGAYNGDMDDFYLTIKTDWYDENRRDSLNMKTSGTADFIALHGRFMLDQGEQKEIRYFRGVQDRSEDPALLQHEIDKLKEIDLQEVADKNVNLFSSIPRIDFPTRNEKLVYLGAFNLVRNCMLPPSGETNYNFYVFSRNPKWGWGHGHQVLHESLSMMAYVYLDPESAQNSQRVYMEQQGPDGLIAYRHGPRGTQAYPHKGMPTTSAPFFNWINWEIYKVSGDRKFLEEAYGSGSRYAEWLIRNRDRDHDGTFEWGPYGLIENVRDWYNVIFQVSEERYLDIDKEDISDELECLDLSIMMIKEFRCLAYMASMLGKINEAEQWNQKATRTADLVNDIMWDEESGFYYHVDKVNHEFRFLDRDLKRMEIIGFLPLWAEIAPPDRAVRLVQKLIDPALFWRKYGVPTLSAKDEWYSPNVDYCCKWNGPVWLLWDYMVLKGLLNYGFIDLAQELGDKMLLAVTTQLSLNHNFWESYSPDNEVLDCPSNYIWDAIMAKVLIEMYNIRDSEAEERE